MHCHATMEFRDGTKLSSSKMKTSSSDTLIRISDGKNSVEVGIHSLRHIIDELRNSARIAGKVI